MTVPVEGELDEAYAATLVPERDPRGHKGTFGRVVIVAGSLDYAGAALMSGAAALRAGSGLVTLCLPASVQPHLAGRMPELITCGLPESGPGDVDAAEAAAAVIDIQQDALLIGPGLRAGRGTTRLVEALLAVEGCPAVADAGALNALATVPGWWTRIGRACVLTPHPGELQRLGVTAGSSDEERHTAAVGAAAAWGQVVALKGARTVLADPDGRALVAPFSLPALGSAGTGDVLGGVIASLLGQGLAPFEAAALGVYLHGSAGEALSERMGDAGLLATDLLPEIPRQRRHLALRRERGRARLGFSWPAGPGEAVGPGRTTRPGG